MHLIRSSCCWLVLVASNVLALTARAEGCSDAKWVVRRDGSAEFHSNRQNAEICLPKGDFSQTPHLAVDRVLFEGWGKPRIKNLIGPEQEPRQEEESGDWRFNASSVGVVPGLLVVRVFVPYDSLEKEARDAETGCLGLTDDRGRMDETDLAKNVLSAPRILLPDAQETRLLRAERAKTLLSNDLVRTFNEACSNGKVDAHAFTPLLPLLESPVCLNPAFTSERVGCAFQRELADRIELVLRESSRPMQTTEAATCTTCRDAGAFARACANVAALLSEADALPKSGAPKSPQDATALQNATESPQDATARQNAESPQDATALQNATESPQDKNAKLLQGFLTRETELQNWKPQNQAPVLLVRTEVVATEDTYFSSASFADDAVRRNPVYPGTPMLVRLDGYPHAFPGALAWTRRNSDSTADLRTIAQFAGFVVSSVSSLKLPAVTVAARAPDAEWGKPPGPPEDKTVRPERVDDARYASAAEMPPIVPIGSRFIGPITVSPDTEYVLAVEERVAAELLQNGNPVLPIRQRVRLWPRADWDVTLVAGVELGAISSGRAYEVDEWVPIGPSGGSTALFEFQGRQDFRRRASVSLGLGVFPPWGLLNWNQRRIGVVGSVAAPVTGGGVSQYSIGPSLRFLNGFLLTVFAGARTWNASVEPAVADESERPRVFVPVDAAGDAKAPPVPTRPAVDFVLGIGLGVDLANIGSAVLDGAKGVFEKKE